MNNNIQPINPEPSKELVQYQEELRQQILQSLGVPKHLLTTTDSNYNRQNISFLSEVSSPTRRG